MCKDTMLLTAVAKGDYAAPSKDHKLLTTKLVVELVLTEDPSQVHKICPPLNLIQTLGTV